ncbi:MAG TPA: DUF2330 domain-containing protein [Kofleriaceae bacterium]|nr:DUF2330 domain-containing protein [Kofleriaceae bacterium]
MSWLSLIVLGRILAQSGFEPPRVSDDAVVLIRRANVTVGCPGDAGISDGGMIGDASVGDAAVADAGTADGGLGDAGLGDAGVPDASTCETILGPAITMIVQPHVASDSDGRFAVLYVTPSRPIVELAAPEVFSQLALVTAPRTEIKTVEIEDPAEGTYCSNGCGGGARESSDSGGGCGGGDYGPSWTPPGTGDGDLGDGGVVTETVGPYEVLRAQPTSTSELAGWLDQLGYAYAPADLDAVAPYIGIGYHVVALRITLKKPTEAPLVPIALTWAGNELRLPAAAGRGAPGPGPLTVYIATTARYQFPGATVHYAGYASTATDAPFVTRQEVTVDPNLPMEQDPIANISYEGDVQEVNTVTHEVHVPAGVYCEDDQDSGCCDTAAARSRTRYDMLSIVAALAFVLRRPRRRRDR